MTACPFRLCSADVTMVIEKADPSPMPQGLMRVPQHPLGGHEEFGLCPASLLYIPLSRYDADQMEEQAQVIERMLQDRGARAATPSDPEGAAGPTRPPWLKGYVPRSEYQPGRVAQPAKNPYWFRNSERQGPYDGHGGGYTAPPALPQVLLPPLSAVREPTGFVGPTTMGETAGMATVEKVQEIIAAAEVIAAKAIDELFVMEGEVGEALALIDGIRETSVDPMGAPQLRDAIEKIGEANAALRAAIEIGATYRSQM